MHQYIIGATRSGKFNYLMILAGSEEPFCFIDKHGTTARAIADASRCAFHSLTSSTLYVAEPARQ
jgi:hypothetical protein